MPTVVMETTMRRVALTIVLLTLLNAPAFAQKAAIEAVNAKWMELFNKGDFDGIGQLYSADATAFPPGAAMVKGRPAIAAMWKGMAGQVTDPKVTTLEVKRFGTHAVREIGTFSLKTKGASPKEVTGKYVVLWEKVRGQWKMSSDIWNDGK
jgi:ketosteroid isomerase-like protein